MCAPRSWPSTAGDSSNAWVRVSSAVNSVAEKLRHPVSIFVLCQDTFQRFVRAPETKGPSESERGARQGAGQGAGHVGHATERSVGKAGTRPHVPPAPSSTPHPLSRAIPSPACPQPTPCPGSAFPHRQPDLSRKKRKLEGTGRGLCLPTPPLQPAGARRPAGKAAFPLRTAHLSPPAPSACRVSAWCCFVLGDLALPAWFCVMVPRSSPVGVLSNERASRGLRYPAKTSYLQAIQPRDSGSVTAAPTLIPCPARAAVLGESPKRAINNPASDTQRQHQLRNGLAAPAGVPGALPHCSAQLQGAAHTGHAAAPREHPPQRSPCPRHLGFCNRGIGI